MQIDKPLVSILLAVYRPNEKWLIEQLNSLNNQTYENLELYVYDDCPEQPVNESLFKKYITNFKYSIIKGKVNVGSNKAFERLTLHGKGEYFAYCDQDDIWEENKISLMMEKFINKDITLACCDLYIIDKDGKKTHESIREIRKRLIYKSGYNLAEDLLNTNFVTGCAMIVRGEIAISAIPFLDELIHDQWIAIIAAQNGKIEFIDIPCVGYRQHESNQTGILKGVYNKESYYDKRIIDYLKRCEALEKRLCSDEKLKKSIENCYIWIRARNEYSQKITISSLKTMIKYRHFHKESVFIETILPFIPDFIFKYIIMLTKRGLI